MKNNIFQLNENVVLVAGMKRGAVYDFTTKKVYSINEDALQFLVTLLHENKDVYDSSEVNYLLDLEKKGLLFSGRKIKIFKQPVKRSLKLKFTWLELTERCNERCLHCYEEFESRERATDEMKLEKWKSILDELTKIGCSKIQFIGGEPLLYNGINALIEYANKLNFDEITLFTNAVLLDEKQIEFLQKNKVRVRVSLYAHSAGIHDAITQVKGSFDKTVANLKLLKMHEVPTSIAVIIMKENQDFIEETKSFIESIGHKYNGYDVIRQVYGGRQQPHLPTRNDVIDSRVKKEANFVADKKFFEKALHHNTCWSGKFAITSSGEIIPCIFARDIVIGDLNKQSIDEILASEILAKYWNLSKDFVDKCKDCEYRYCCKDCRPLGIARDGNLYSKQSRCTYNPMSGEWE